MNRACIIVRHSAQKIKSYCNPHHIIQRQKYVKVKEGMAWLIMFLHIVLNIYAVTHIPENYRISSAIPLSKLKQLRRKREEGGNNLLMYK